jgi:hypothetical protein
MLDDSELLPALIASVKVTSAQMDAQLHVAKISNMQVTQKKHMIKAEELARTFGIGIDAAHRTLKVTTQRGIRTVLHPNISRRFRTNDRQLRYRRLPYDLYTDTLKSSGVTSAHGNNFAQVFVAKNGWMRAMPTVAERQEHEALSLLFRRDGVPPTIICDGAKTQIKGEFRRKCNDAGTGIKQTEPYSAFQNAAEPGIKELKRGSKRQQVRAASPKVFWDDCIEREAYVRSLTALNFYSLQGQVPETIMSGQTGDISPWAAFAWYEWVYFHDSAVRFPNDSEILGRDLGPAIDVGPAMTRKLLKQNGQVVYRSTVRALTPDEIHSETEKQKRAEFDIEIRERLGVSFKYDDEGEAGDLPPGDITPTYEPYEDDTTPSSSVPDIDDVDPVFYDNYVGAQVTLLVDGELQNA